MYNNFEDKIKNNLQTNINIKMEYNVKISLVKGVINKSLTRP